MGDSVLFVADFSREFGFGRFGAICCLLFKRVWVWEIWCYLLLSFLESLGVGDLEQFVADISREFGCRRFGINCH